MFADVYKLLKVYMATCGFASLARASIVINIMNGGTKLLSIIQTIEVVLLPVLQNWR